MTGEETRLEPVWQRHGLDMCCLLFDTPKSGCLEKRVPVSVSQVNCMGI